MLSNSKFLFAFCLKATIVFSFFSCTYSPYDKSKYLMNNLFRSIIANYNEGDTIRFVNNEGQYQIFLITRSDSIVFDKRGHFINTKLSNTVNLYYKQLFPIKEKDASKFILITTYPDSQISNISFFFKNSHSVKSNTLGIPLNDLSDTGLVFLNGSYPITNENSNADPNSITELYVKENSGIIAFKQNDSTIWKLE